MLCLHKLGFGLDSIDWQTFWHVSLIQFIVNLILAPCVDMAVCFIRKKGHPVLKYDALFKLILVIYSTQLINLGTYLSNIVVILHLFDENPQWPFYWIYRCGATVKSLAFLTLQGLREIPKIKHLPPAQSECQWYHLKARLKSFTMGTNVEGLINFEIFHRFYFQIMVTKVDHRPALQGF
jgi:hypothetical protein